MGKSLLCCFCSFCLLLLTTWFSFTIDTFNRNVKSQCLNHFIAQNVNKKIKRPMTGWYVLRPSISKVPELLQTRRHWLWPQKNNYLCRRWGWCRRGRPAHYWLGGATLPRRENVKAVKKSVKSMSLNNLRTTPSYTLLFLQHLGFSLCIIRWVASMTLSVTKWWMLPSLL